MSAGLSASTGPGDDQMNTMIVLVIIGVCVSLLTSIIAITVVVANLRSSVDMLNKQEERLTGKNEQMLRDQTELLVLVKAFIAKQAVINEQVAETLKTLREKLEGTERSAGESNSMMGLLAEVLKNKRIVDIG